ncbi:MAG: hypothetical protein OXH09_12440 [Gammaproteobacteria bacterium]|nr:hypothetical protein [Gammaproteobacteria bacterium]
MVGDRIDAAEVAGRQPDTGGEDDQERGEVRLSHAITPMTAYAGK